MISSKKTFRWIAITGGLLLLIAVSLLLILPKLFNLDPIRDRVQSALSQRIKVEVKIGGLELQFIPRPQITLRQIQIRGPEESRGSIDTLILYPRLWEFLRARLLFEEARALRPEFTINLYSREKVAETVTRDAGLWDVDSRVRDTLSRIASVMPGMDLKVRRGSLEILKDKRLLAWFREANCDLDLDLDKTAVRAVSRSNLWEKGTIEVEIRNRDLNVKGHISLEGFRPHILAGQLWKTTSYRISDSGMNADLDFTADGPGAIEVKVLGSGLHATLSRGKEILSLKGKNLDAQFMMKGELIGASVKELVLEYPRLTLSGDLEADRRTRLVSLELVGKGIQVDSAKQAVLRLFRQEPRVGRIFDMIRGGEIPEVRIRSRGRTLKEMMDTDRVSIQGHVKQGEVRIPGLHLNLNDVKGTARIAKGVLEGEDLEASFGTSRGHGGRLRLDLRDQSRPFNLDIDFQADLSQLQTVLGKVLKESPLKSELDLLKGLKGVATGRLLLDASGSGLDITTDVTSFNLFCDYARYPYPISISNGRLRLAGGELLAENIRGAIGSSSFNGLSLEANLDKRSMRIALQHAEINAPEVLSWVNRLKKLREALGKFRTVGGGTILIETLEVQGPLFDPGKWAFAVEGDLRGLSISSEFLPDPVNILEARLKTTGNPKTQTGIILDARIKYMDATMRTSGTLKDYLKGVRGLDMEIDGTLGSAFVEWLRVRLSMPAAPKLRPPIDLSKGRLMWERGLKTHFTGDLQFAKGPHILADLLHEPKRGLKQNLVIQDRGYEASMYLKTDPSAHIIDIAFEGQLSGETVRAILAFEEPFSGLVRGDMRAHILRGQLHRSTFQGFLSAQEVVVPHIADGFPVNRVEKLRIEASEGRGLRLQPTVFLLGGQEMELNGTVTFQAEGLWLDLDLFAEMLDLTEVKRSLKGQGNGKTKQGISGPLSLPLKGVIRFEAGEITYKDFKWSPFAADLGIFPERVLISVKEANLCGISMPADVELKVGQSSVDMKIGAEGEELLEVLSCLSKKGPIMTGRLDVQGALRSRGRRDEMIRSFQGEVLFSAQNGIIKRHVPLQTLLTYLNLTEFFKGRLPDISKEGFPYRSMKSKIGLKDGTLHIQEGIIDAPSMEIFAEGKIDPLTKDLDLTLIVSPLRTVDTVLKNIPVVGYITGGSLISMAFKVKGPWDDPKVSPLPPSAVGAGLVGMVKRTLKLPVKVIEPVLNREQDLGDTNPE